MTELKSAEYWEDMWHDADMMTLEEIIKKAQRNAIEAALELAAENAKLYSDGYMDIPQTQKERIRGVLVSKKSITSLITHEKLKVCASNI